MRIAKFKASLRIQSHQNLCCLLNVSGRPKGNFSEKTRRSLANAGHTHQGNDLTNLKFFLQCGSCDFVKKFRKK